MKIEDENIKDGKYRYFLNSKIQRREIQMTEKTRRAEQDEVRLLSKQALEAMYKSMQIILSDEAK